MTRCIWKTSCRLAHVCCPFSFFLAHFFKAQFVIPGFFKTPQVSEVSECHSLGLLKTTSRYCFPQAGPESVRKMRNKLRVNFETNKLDKNVVFILFCCPVMVTKHRSQLTTSPSALIIGNLSCCETTQPEPEADRT